MGACRMDKHHRATSCTATSMLSATESDHIRCVTVTRPIVRRTVKYVAHGRKQIPFPSYKIQLRGGYVAGACRSDFRRIRHNSNDGCYKTRAHRFSQMSIARRTSMKRICILQMFFLRLCAVAHSRRSEHLTHRLKRSLLRSPPLSVQELHGRVSLASELCRPMRDFVVS
jgi:hypothetical protein